VVSDTVAKLQRSAQVRLAERTARLRDQPGLLGRWFAALDQARGDLVLVEQESGELALRVRARLVRWFYELLVLAVIGLAKLVGLWHQAGRALAVPPRRR
jgi:hypothetical protein